MEDVSLTHRFFSGDCTSGDENLFYFELGTSNPQVRVDGGELYSVIKISSVTEYVVLLAAPPLGQEIFVQVQEGTGDYAARIRIFTEPGLPRCIVVGPTANYASWDICFGREDQVSLSHVYAFGV